MSHVLHVFRKDVRRLRWALVSWLAVVIARLILKTAGAELSFCAVGLHIAVANIGDLLLFAAVFLVVVPTVGESIAIAMISGDLQVVLRAAPAYAFSQMLWVSLLMA